MIRTLNPLQGGSIYLWMHEDGMIRLTITLPKQQDRLYLTREEAVQLADMAKTVAQAAGPEHERYHV